MLGLGKQLDYSGSGTLSLPLLTDHLVLPVVERADVRVFSEGFLVERLEVNCAPVMVSIGSHVERVWVVDSAEVMEQAARQLPAVSLALPLPDLPSGLLVVFRLKELDGEAVPGLFHYNPLSKALPFLSCNGGNNDATARHIAFFVRTGCRAAAAMTTACAAWRVACRVNDVQEHRGADVGLPVGILKAFVAAIDVWGFSGASSEEKQGELTYSPTDISSELLVSAGSLLTQNPKLSVVGLGFLPMR